MWWKRFLSRKLLVAVGLVVANILGLDPDRMATLLGAIYIGAEGLADAVSRLVVFFQRKDENENGKLD